MNTTPHATFRLISLWLLILTFPLSLFAQDINKIVEANNQLAFAIYKESEAQPGNTISSPYSALNLLSLLREGTDDATKNEIDKSLKLSTDNAEAIAAYRKVLDQFNTRSDTTITLKNSLWIADDFPVYPGFQSKIKRDFDATAERADFGIGLFKTTELMNDWVKEATEGKIERIMHSRLLSTDTQLVALNTMYFKSSWKKPFKQNETRQTAFYENAQTQHTVPMMHLYDTINYSKTEGWEMIRLPMADGSFALDVLLPTNPSALANKTAKFNEETLEQLDNKLKTYKVDVLLPRFSVSQLQNLNDTFKDLGIKEIFTPEANFSKLTQRENIQVNWIIQSSNFTIDETGTTASSATAAGMPFGPSENPDELQPVKFHANRPFCFALRETRTGMLLYIGRLTQPQE